MSLTLSVSDDLDNWADAFAFSAGIPMSVSEDMDNLGDALGKFSAWNISFGEQLVLTDRLFADFLLTISKGDNLNSWSDNLTITEKGLYELDKGENLDNLSDALTKIVGHQLNVGDAFVGHADRLSVVLALRKILSENLNNWSDSANIVASLVSHSIVEGDNLKFLVDSINILFGHRLQVGDSLNNWSDSLNIVQLTDLTLDLSDDLDNWSDAVAVSLTIRGETAIKETIVDYVRKYLNE